ncbi:MAG: LON peptidase substrate-binding domain-containing protein [Hyphomicrobiales bacterium]
MELPLFPLRTVLFPGMALPLQIFEERYRTMVGELLETGGEFGVLLIREGNEVGGGAIPFDVGTTAVIERCQEIAGGRYLLTGRGQRRFRLLKMLPPRPYPYGEIEYVEERTPGPTPELTAAVEHVHEQFPQYFRLALSLTDQWARGMRLPDEPHALVDFLAPWLQAAELEKQQLLEAEEAHERLQRLSALLDQLLERTRNEAEEYRRRKHLGFGAAN